MGVKLCDILDIHDNRVKIRNVTELERKINKIVHDGKDNLQVVADFDCTLTKQKVENGKLLTSFGMFGECPSVPDSYKSEDKKLCDIYKPIEVDPNMSVEEKTVHMVDWYRKVNDVLKGFRFPEEELDAISKTVGKNLRDGVCEMFVKLEGENVPVLVFSAGLGNSIEAVLRNCKILTPNVKVISNFLNIDENGIIDGTKGDVIHVFNKNETAIKHTEYYDLIKDRCNVILLGDSIGDAGMADGIEHSEAVIKIGFLYHNPEGNLPNYMNHFDIVLLDDQTVDIPSAIINLIIKPQVV